MPSFTQLLEAIDTAWHQDREQIADQAGRMVEAVSSTIPAGDLPGDETLETAYRMIAGSFDRINGGFGAAPKFPQQPVLEFLLRVREQNWADEADRFVAQTLVAMADGGIHDQIGGGFSRYSVDERWLVPHFEKMLYDNAQLARIYLWAGIELARPDFVAVARSTLAYLERDLSRPDGGFYSAEDADSEGVEGKFYVWSAAEMREVLGDEAAAVIAYYGVTEAGNFEGSNILSRVGPERPGGIAESNRLLLDARSRRVRPALDDKVVTVWHGMAVRAFAEAGAALGDDHLDGVALRAGRFAADRLAPGGAVVRSWRDGRASGPGFLDDHASLALGYLSLYAASGDEEWFDRAMGLVGQLQRFARREGGFYSTAADGPDLLKRPFDITDNPHASGNAMAAEALLLASLYTGEASWRDEAESAVAASSRIMDRHPTMVAHHMSVANDMTRALELAVVGADAEHLVKVQYARFRPHVAMAVATGTGSQVPLLADRTPSPDGSARAFVCRNFVCELPVTDPVSLAAQLDS